jgi:hypothetical protein
VVLAHHKETKTHALATLLAIASDYRVELATLDELEQVANNHGSPLPDDLRPATAAASEQGQASGAVAGEADRSSTTPDATPDEVCSAVRVGFDGRPLKSNGADLTGGTSRGFSRSGVARRAPAAVGKRRGRDSYRSRTA